MQCINVLSGYQHKMCMRQINLVFRIESVPFLRPFIVYKQKLEKFQTFVLKTFQISHSQPILPPLTNGFQTSHYHSLLRIFQRIHLAMPVLFGENHQAGIKT